MVISCKLHHYSLKNVSKMLTNKDIQKLASAKNVKTIAVENFLYSLSGNKSNDYENMQMDARLYKWNAATVSAISKGISMQ